ncbi:MAG: DUF2905 domain-containing protein [Candidatus Omnitrophica bacterium]|nr:DUF2905 domain-containing protein [Candidatus Omnitrophota bacterium]
MNVSGFGRMLIIFGAVAIAFGALFIFASKVPCIGKLPGDICVKKGNFTFYFPLATSLLFSIVISLVLFFIGRRQ